MTESVGKWKIVMNNRFPLKRHMESVWQFWERINTTGLCLAPMVEVNDLAFRLQTRRHGIGICWTGMINNYQWNTSKTYRERNIQHCPEDHPLVGQLSGGIDGDYIEAARTLEDFVEAIEINLGCCQKVAKRGGFGYFMVDTESKRCDVLELIRKIVREIKKPLFVKIRLINGDNGEPDQEKTVEFARSLATAGASLITIHARSMFQDKKGDPSTEVIKAIVQAVNVPVVANGGIDTPLIVEHVKKETGAAGVMIGQALLRNPSAFSDSPLNQFDIAREYLEIYQQVGGTIDVARRHLFYFLDEALGTDSAKRAQLGQCHSIEELLLFIQQIETPSS